MTLTEFLLAQIDVDDAAASGDRAAAEVAAKRGIVAEHADRDPAGVDETGAEFFVCRCCTEYGTPVLSPCRTLRFLGSVYADRDGYLEEWAPALVTVDGNVGE